jgi:hypothetical protein
MMFFLHLTLDHRENALFFGEIDCKRDRDPEKYVPEIITKLEVFSDKKLSSGDPCYAFHRTNRSNTNILHSSTNSTISFF